MVYLVGCVCVCLCMGVSRWRCKYKFEAIDTSILDDIPDDERKPRLYTQKISLPPHNPPHPLSSHIPVFRFLPAPQPCLFFSLSTLSHSCSFSHQPPTSTRFMRKQTRFISCDSILLYLPHVLSCLLSLACSPSLALPRVRALSLVCACSLQ